MAFIFFTLVHILSQQNAKDFIFHVNEIIQWSVILSVQNMVITATGQLALKPLKGTYIFTISNNTENKL